MTVVNGMHKVTLFAWRFAAAVLCVACHGSAARPPQTAPAAQPAANEPVKIEQRRFRYAIFPPVAVDRPLPDEHVNAYVAEHRASLLHELAKSADAAKDTVGWATVRSIKVPLSEQRSPEEDRALAESIRARILGGETFKAVAESLRDEGVRGEYVPHSSPEIMIKEYAEAMRSLPVGTLSQPIETRLGYFIVEVLERDDTPPSEAQMLRRRAEERMVAELRQRGAEEHAARVLAQLRQGASWEQIDFPKAPSPGMRMDRVEVVQGEDSGWCGPDQAPHVAAVFNAELLGASDPTVLVGDFELARAALLVPAGERWPDKPIALEDGSHAVLEIIGSRHVEPGEDTQRRRCQRLTADAR